MKFFRRQFINKLKGRSHKTMTRSKSCHHNILFLLSYIISTRNGTSDLKQVKTILTCHGVFLPYVSFHYPPNRSDRLCTSPRETEVQALNRKYLFVLSSSSRYECIMYCFVHSKSKQINLTFMIARFHLHRTLQNKQHQLATVGVPYR